MRSQTWSVAGAAVVAAGVLMLGMAYATSGVVHAGNQIPCDATPTVFTDKAESLSVGNGAPAFQAAGFREECTATATPQQRLKTHTPTPTNTEAPKTNTPVPTPTQPAPTATPKAVSESVSVKPPNTGSGSGGSGSMTLWLLVLGTAAVALGGGTVLVGVRRR
jgi:hypothetical protein